MTGQCPVCRARFRGSRLCSRCGADLSPLMMLAARAWQLRERSRGALATGDPAYAAELANASQRLHRTPAGEALRLLATWLARPAVRLPTFKGEGLQDGLSLDEMGAIYDRMDGLR
jgi:predicted amidophosphoribosyltransferase